MPKTHFDLEMVPVEFVFKVVLFKILLVRPIPLGLAALLFRGAS